MLNQNTILEKQIIKKCVNNTFGVDWRDVKKGRQGANRIARS